MEKISGLVISEHNNSKRIINIDIEDEIIKKLLFPFNKFDLTALELKPFTRFTIAKSLDDLTDNKLSKLMNFIIRDRSTGCFIIAPKNISSNINDELPKLYSTPELNISVTDENKFKIIEDFSSQCSLKGEKITIDGLRINFQNGWGLIRASNTTPKLVMRFEGNSMEALNDIQNDFINELSRICPNIDINLE